MWADLEKEAEKEPETHQPFHAGSSNATLNAAVLLMLFGAAIFGSVARFSYVAGRGFFGLEMQVYSQRALALGECSSIGQSTIRKPEKTAIGR